MRKPIAAACTLLLTACFTLSSFAASYSVADRSFTKRSQHFFKPLPKPTRTSLRSPLWHPLYSLVVPGLNQWIEGEKGPAAAYSGLAVAGLGVQFSALHDPDEEITSWQEQREYDKKKQRFFFGAQMYQVAGSLSAYHAFRTSALSHINAGNSRFDFLKPTINENSADVMLAPFDFSYLSNWTTYVPLLSVLALVVNDTSNDDEETTLPNLRNEAYALGYSYNAGVGEEAMFRGWLHPYMYSVTGSSFWANAVQGTIFGLLHDTGGIPWIQLGVGYYLGWLTEHNQWSIKEATFVHTWWDIIAFTALSMSGDQPGVYIPFVQMGF